MKKYIIIIKKVLLILGNRVVFVETGACSVFSPFWFYQLKSTERDEGKHSIVCKTGLCVLFKEQGNDAWLTATECTFKHDSPFSVVSD